MRGPTEAENDSSGGPVHGDVFLVSGGPTSSTEGEMLSVNSENLDPFDHMSGPTEAKNDSSGGRSGCGDLQRKQQLMLKKRRVLSALARLENCVEDAKRRRIIKRQKNKRDERRTFAKSMLRIFRQLSDQRFLEAKEKIEKVLNESLQEQYLSDEEK